MHFKWQEITQSDGAGRNPHSGNAADRSQARHTQKGVNDMTKANTYTAAQNLDNEKIAAIIAGMTPEQRQLIGGLVIGVQIAGQIGEKKQGA